MHLCGHAYLKLSSLVVDNGQVRMFLQVAKCVLGCSHVHPPGFASRPRELVDRIASVVAGNLRKVKHAPPDRLIKLDARRA